MNRCRGQPSASQGGVRSGAVRKRGGAKRGVGAHASRESTKAPGRQSPPYKEHVESTGHPPGPHPQHPLRVLLLPKLSAPFESEVDHREVGHDACRRTRPDCVGHHMGAPLLANCVWHAKNVCLMADASGASSAGSFMADPQAFGHGAEVPHAHGAARTRERKVRHAIPNNEPPWNEAPPSSSLPSLHTRLDFWRSPHQMDGSSLSCEDKGARQGVLAFERVPTLRDEQTVAAHCGMSAVTPRCPKSQDERPHEPSPCPT